MGQRIVLAGGGHAHLAVLEDWARRPRPGSERVLVTSTPQTAYSGMFPGWLAGFYRAEELLIDLRPLAARAGARLIIADIVGLDPERSRLELDGGEWLDYDLLSLATGGETEVSQLASLGERLIPAKPVSGFIESWNAFIDDPGTSPARSIAVVGGGAAGVELALGAAASFRRAGLSGQTTLIAPRGGLLAGHGAAVRKQALAALARAGVGVRWASATGEKRGLRLSDASELACDRVIAATGSRAPGWLAGSGLACTAAGFVAVGSDLRSRSHPNVFAAGDIIERIDRPLARSGVHAVKAGPVLAANLRAAIKGAPLKRYRPRRVTLYLLATGDRRAILSWGPIVAWGRWVWWLKDRIDRGFVGRYTDRRRATPGQTP